MRPGKLNAIMAAGTEIGVGILLILGLATPLAAAGLVALMTVAIVTVHRKNGFFVYNAGQGIEYCLMLAVYALLVSTLVYRELAWRDLYTVFASAAKTTAVVMFLVAAAMVSSWLITIAQIPQQLVSLLNPLLDDPKLLMFTIMVIVMLVGTAMDMTPTILIMTPVLRPRGSIRSTSACSSS